MNERAERLAAIRKNRKLVPVTYRMDRANQIERNRKDENALKAFPRRRPATKFVKGIFDD
jgi:hypothetical protein